MFYHKIEHFEPSSLTLKWHILWQKNFDRIFSVHRITLISLKSSSNDFWVDWLLKIKKKHLPKSIERIMFYEVDFFFPDIPRSAFFVIVMVSVTTVKINRILVSSFIWIPFRSNGISSVIHMFSCSRKIKFCNLKDIDI